MDQEKGPIIPCVYCNHANPASHRFCGLCGKALPDLVKQGPKPGTTVTPIPGAGIGGANRAPQPATPTVSSPPPRPQAPGSRTGTDSPNRDLSYLLHDDHVPPPTNRLPFIVGGLLLAAVAAFFAIRGGGKPAPAATSPAASESAASTPESSTVPESHAPDLSAKSEPPPFESAKTESAKAEPPKPESATAPAEPPAVAPPARAPEPKHTRMPAPVAIAKKPPTPAPRKPSPARQEVAVPQDPPADIASSAAPVTDCDKQVASLRKAAARGDAKARADLGLVYYVGRCVPRDLPTAYHWYALVLRTQPDSPQISAQLEAIWKQMSPAERQLALKPQ